MLTLKLISEETERVIKGLEKKHFEGARETIYKVLQYDKTRRESQQQLDTIKQQQKLFAKRIGGLMKEGKKEEADEIKGQVAVMKNHEKVLQYDKTRRESQQQLDTIKQQQKLFAKRIGGLMKEGKKEEADEIKGQVAVMKNHEKELQEAMDMAQKSMTDLLLQIPNVPNDDVPEGRDANDNVVVKEGGNIPDLGEDALCHWDLLKAYKLVDFDLGVKVTGAGFPIYVGKMARFQRALEAFFLDEARKAGYLEVQPPYLVNEASGYGTGQLPDKEGQMYHAQLDNLYLIPTAEVPVTNIFRDEILEEKDLPMKRCAYSACFRREAGSYGKDVRGLNRLHQFDKVEIVRIDTPKHSYESLKEMLDHVESLLLKLELPYHILRLCGGDMSFTSAICYDFEVWSAAQKRWLEVSSVSNFESYQANRLHCRYRREDTKKTELCHTLNGSALALPRVVAAIIENYQTKGGIRVPKVLVPYCGFDMLDDQNFQ